MKLTEKTILILSQQDWGRMFISKHHYALELAKLGNTVFFVNGPDQQGSLKSGEVVVENTDHQNLYLVKHRLPYPYIIKYKFKALHDYLIRAHFKKMLKVVNKQVDIVWSFDLSDTLPLRAFSDKLYKVYMPVDELSEQTATKAAISADIIFSVTNEILSKFHSCNVPTHLIGHGVSEVFFSESGTVGGGDKIRIGLSGNFLRPDIDWRTLGKVITENKEASFNFWGAYNNNDANLVSADGDSSMPDEVKQMLSYNNVTFHGVVKSEQLASELKKMDGFLICYDIDKDQSKATNYHKILEYLATGGFIVSNNVTAYHGKSELLIMPAERNNSMLPSLFKDAIYNVETLNSEQNRALRISFARKHTYKSNIAKIEQLINTA